MRLTRCPTVENHFYDGDEFFQCPYCNGETQSKVRRKANRTPVAQDMADFHPVQSADRNGDVTVGMDDVDQDATIGMYDDDDIGQTVGMFDDDSSASAEVDDIPVTVDMEEYEDGSQIDVPSSQEQVQEAVRSERITSLPTSDGRQRCINCFEEYYIGTEQCPYCGYKAGDKPKELYHMFQGLLLNHRYIIGEVLGFGGFGITYKAWDQKLDTVVAIKEYYPSGIVNRIPGTQDVVIYAQKRRREFEVGKERFLNEARNMAKFNSEKNIVNVFEFFEENNTAYIVMEFLKGCTLSQHLHEKGVVDTDYGIKVTNAVCNALSKLHGEGIIHRDISPDNIFLCSDGGIKLIDFGAARFANDENKKMTIILKPGFAPPEQYEKVNKQGPWTDIYALGATLYYIITGTKPEESTNRKISDKLPYPHEINPSIPDNLSHAIMKAMAIDIHLRYKNTKEFYDAINKNKKVLRVDEERKKRKRRRAVGIVAASAILVGGISVSAFRWNKNKNEETLPDSSILIWYCKSGDEASDEAEEKSYNAIIEDFNTSFPNVKITLQGFEEEEYISKLKGSEAQPNMYEYIGEDSTGKDLSLKSVFDSDFAGQCSLLKEAKDYFGNEKFLPLGFSAPLFFVNNTYAETHPDSIVKITDIEASDSDDRFGYLADNERFSEMLDIPSEKIRNDAGELFYNEQVVYYGTYTDNYFEVASKMPARYDIIYLGTKKINCKYENIWCANDKNKNENKAALKLLEFMLNENAQDELHIQNVSGSLPINDAVITVYTDVYKQLGKINDIKNNFVFK